MKTETFTPNSMVFILVLVLLFVVVIGLAYANDKLKETSKKIDCLNLEKNTFNNLRRIVAISNFIVRNNVKLHESDLLGKEGHIKTMFFIELISNIRCNKDLLGYVMSYVGETKNTNFLMSIEYDRHGKDSISLLITEETYSEGTLANLTDLHEIILYIDGRESVLPPYSCKILGMLLEYSVNAEKYLLDNFSELNSECGILKTDMSISSHSELGNILTSSGKETS